MRSLLRKELNSCFRRELQARFPQFNFVSQERGTSTWAWKIAPNLTFFIMSQPFERTDQFVMEVSWSENGEYPWGAMGKIKVDQPQGRQRLGRLWESGRDEPIWDLAPEKTAGMQEHKEALSRGQTLDYPADPPTEQILPLICPLVREAVNKFEQYGLPLFRQVAEIRGLSWPS
jgi:hypothetical protein